MFLSTALHCSMLFCAFLIPFTCCVWLTVENALSFFPSKTKWNFCVVREKDQYLILWVTLKDWGKKSSCKKSKESFVHKVIQFYKMVCCVVGNWVKLFFMNHNCIFVYHFLHTIAKVQKTSTLVNTTPNNILNRVKCCYDKKNAELFFWPGTIYS